MALFTNVDFPQVRSLVRFSLKSEWRTNSARLSRGKRKTSAWWLVWTLFSYLIVGGMLGAIFIRNHEPDAFVAASALVSLYVMLLTASNIFLAFGTGFLSPNETEILSPFPITSETFYASRIAILLTYTLITSTTISIGPMIAAAFFSPGIAALSAVGMLLTTSLSAIASAMGVITLYGLVIRRVPHKRLTRVFGYVQFFGSLLVASSFILLPQLIDRNHLAEVALSAASTLRLLPPYWFASFVAILSDHASGAFGIMALAALALVVLLSVASGRLLARSYRASVEDLAISSFEDTKRASSKVRSKRGSGAFAIGTFFLRAPESRAVWTLFKAQFKFDSKFRLSILSWLPVTGMYFILAVMQGAIHDPFAGFDPALLRSNALYMAAIFSPLFIMQQISQTESYKASWIFFAMPIDRARLVLGVRNIVVLLIFIPYMVLLCVAFSYYMPFASAAKHTLMISALAQLIFQGSLLIAPKMPFSEQRKQQRNSVGRIFFVIFLIIVPLALLGFIIYFGYRDAVRYWSSLALLATLAVIADQFVRRRLQKKLELQEYTG